MGLISLMVWETNNCYRMDGCTDYIIKQNIFRVLETLITLTLKMMMMMMAMVAARALI